MKNSWQWFVHPKNLFTNESIATTFNLSLEEWLDESGRNMEVFRVQWRNVDALEKARRCDTRFKFDVYCRWGNSGPIKMHEMFLKRKKVKVSKGIEKQLKKLKK